MLALAEDTITDDEIRERTAKISGQALDKLASLNLHKQMEEIFMAYFKATIKDKNQIVKKWTAFNLPCYFCYFRNSKENNATYFDGLFLDLIKDENTSIDVLKTLASSFHETLAIIPNDQSIGNLKECLKILMTSEHKII